MEGKVVGECASELKRLWATLMPSLGARKLCLDLRGVLYLDGKGKQVLQEIVEAMAAEILADSPLTKQFADEARRNLQKRGKEHARSKRS